MRQGNLGKTESARDVVRGLLSKRKLQPTGFLQKRKYILAEEALDAGLEFAVDNPVHMVVLKLHEMHRYVAGANMMQMMKTLGRYRKYEEFLVRNLGEGVAAEVAEDGGDEGEDEDEGEAGGR